MKYILIAILLTISISSLAQEKVEFSREKMYDRMTMSRERLIKLIKAIDYYHNENLPDSISLDIYRKHAISLEVGKEDESQTLTGFKQIEQIELDGRKYSKLDILYLNQQQPISSINLNLASYSRRLAIKGTDQQRVNALFRELDEHLVDSEDFLGFVNWNAILSTALFCLMLLAQLIFFQIKPQENNTASIRLAKTIKFVCVVYSVIWLLLMLSPFELSSLFPGFSLSSDPTHWWDKYANFIGVFSFLGTALFGIIKFLSKILIFTNTQDVPRQEDGTTLSDR
ncbi:hypothetical protein ACFE6N_16125 [Pedobacter sp. BG31]|uniref:hypothetical protein n=1 Tax=Pedobacter sp. BG31 TaxID=3349697 RepID=UPI0035F384F3